MYLKTIAISLFLLIIYSANCFCQEKKNLIGQKSQMAQDLKLESKVAKQFDSINKNYKTEINNLSIKSSSKKNLKKLTALEEKRDEELQTILTKKEFETYIVLRRKQREQMRSLIRKKK